MKLVTKTTIPLNYKDVFDQFNQELFESLTLPLVDIEVLQFEGTEVNDQMILKINLPLGLSQHWHGIVREKERNDEQCYFMDEGFQLPFPLKSWQHYHRIYNRGQECWIVDEVHFLSKNLFFDLLLYPLFKLQFLLRKSQYRRFFIRCN